MEEVLIPRRKAWLWPNVLSLDAPFVAVVWSALFCRAFQIAVSPAVLTALALAVWCIYVVDRLFDSYGRLPLTAPARHVFCGRYWARFASGATGGLAALGVLCSHLDAAVARSGLYLLGIVIVYFAFVHGEPLNAKRFWPKELVVGCVFSAGCSLPVWSEREPGVDFVVSSILFALLCAANCLAIDGWERDGWRLEARLRDGLSRWLARHFAPAMALLGLVSVGGTVLAAEGVRPLYAALALASLALLSLSLFKRFLSADALRVLADAALLTPLVAWLALR